MKKLIVLITLASLTGCAAFTPSATSPAQQQAQLQAAWVQQCTLYRLALAAAVANQAKLTNAQLQQAMELRDEINPLCLSQPTDPQAETVKITAAVTTLSILGAAHAAGVVK